MSWNLGPGLTTQLGPFKVNKRDFPQIQRRPWKGGGVPAGGQKHSGHGNWMNTMNPVPRPMNFPEPSPVSNYSKYASIITPLDLFKKSFKKPSTGRFSKPFRRRRYYYYQKLGLGGQKNLQQRQEEDQDQQDEDTQSTLIGTGAGDYQTPMVSPTVSSLGSPSSDVPIQTSGINFVVPSSSSSSSSSSSDIVKDRRRKHILQHNDNLKLFE